jgi:hypothetical protein
VRALDLGGMCRSPRSSYGDDAATQDRTSTPTEVLAGLVERVTFHNDENGFCVLRVKARGQRDLITVLGHAPMIAAGEFVQASGSWINDRTHGVQFRASFLRATAPTTTEGIGASHAIPATVEGGYIVVKVRVLSLGAVPFPGPGPGTDYSGAGQFGAGREGGLS